MNLTHLLQNSEHSTLSSPDPRRADEHPVLDGPQMRIPAEALSLDRLVGGLQEISARNDDATEAIDVVVSARSSSWAGQEGPEMASLIATTAEMSRSIHERGVTQRPIRWWLCVDLDGAAERVCAVARAAGEKALRELVPISGMVGTLVLMGEPEASAAALQGYLADPQFAGSCMIDLTGPLDASGRIEARVVDVALDNEKASLATVSTAVSGVKPHDDLERTHGDLFAEMEVVHSTLAHLLGQLRTSSEEYLSQRSQLSEAHREHADTSRELVGVRNELVAIRSEMAARAAHVSVLGDEAEALRREIDYLEEHRSSLQRDLGLERAAMRAAHEETVVQLAAAEQMRSAATRAEIENSQQRAAAEELRQRVEATQCHLDTITDTVTAAEESLESLEAALTERSAEVERLEQQRIRRKSEIDRFEQSMLARLDPMRSELQEVHERIDEALARLEAVNCERSAVLAAQAEVVGTEAAAEFDAARVVRDHLRTECEQMQVEYDRLGEQITEATAELERLIERSSAEDERWERLRADGTARLQEIEARQAEQSAAADALSAQNLDARELLDAAQAELAAVQEQMAAEHRRLDDRTSALEAEIAAAVESRWQALLAAPRAERRKILRAIRDQVQG